MCNGTGVVTHDLTLPGEPADYEPVDCECVEVEATVSNGYWGERKVAVTVMTGDGPETGWASEPEFCRREPTWSTCPICEDGGWVRSKVDGTLVYCRCEVGQWTREQDAPATNEPGMVA